MVAVPSRAGGSLLRSLLLTLVLIVMGVALLYAYRSQTPSVQSVVYSQAIQEINGGQVKKVTIVANKATLELANGQKQETIVPQPPEPFEKIVNDYNAANPTRTVVLEYQSDTSGFQVLGSILLSLLPVLLLGGFFYYTTRKSRRR